MDFSEGHATKTYHKKAYPSIDPTRPELSAKGKTIVITGGGTGIGAETAIYFAKAGASRIGLLGRREKPLQDTKAKIVAEYPNTEVLAIPTDVVKQSDVDAAFEKIAAGGKIDVLISNAAVTGYMGRIGTTTAAGFMEGVITNIQSNVNVTLAFLKRASEDPVLIETNSAAAHMTIIEGFGVYNVSKAATARFYTSLAFEHPKLRTYSIQPGVVATDMNKSAGYKETKEGEESEWTSNGGDAFVQYDDVSLPAAFFVWVASDEARFLKGKFLWANWDVDELKAKAKEIEGSSLLKLALIL